MNVTVPLSQCRLGSEVNVQLFGVSEVTVTMRPLAGRDPLVSGTAGMISARFPVFIGPVLVKSALNTKQLLLANFEKSLFIVEISCSALSPHGTVRCHDFDTSEPDLLPPALPPPPPVGGGQG